MIISMRHASKFLFLCLVSTSLSLQSCSSSEDADDAEVSASEDGDKSAAPPEEDGALEDKAAEAAPEKAPPPAQAEAPATEVPAEVEGQQAETAAPAAVPAPSKAAAVAEAPSDGTRIVRYVSAKSAALRDQPTAKGKKVGTATRGDHMLVTIQGAWARTDDGKFIETKNLSAKPIGKKKRGAVWK